MYIYTPLCTYWIALYRYVLVVIVPHVDIELEDNKQFISNIPRIPRFSFKASWFSRRRFLSLFTIFGHGGHLVRWRGTIQTNCQYRFDSKPYVKSGENLLKQFQRRQYGGCDGLLGFWISIILAIFGLEVILLLQWNFQLKSPKGSGGCQKLVFKMTAVAAILDFWSAKFYVLLIYKSFCCYNVSFNSNHQMVQKQTSKFALQYSGCGGHFGIPVRMILVTFTSAGWHVTLS